MRQTDKSLQSEKFKQVVGGLGKPLGKSPAPDRIQSPRDLDRSFSCWPGSGYFGTAPGGVLSTAEGPRPFQLGTPDRHSRGAGRRGVATGAPPLPTQPPPPTPLPSSTPPPPPAPPPRPRCQRRTPLPPTTATAAAAAAPPPTNRWQPPPSARATGRGLPPPSSPRRSPPRHLVGRRRLGRGRRRFGDVGHRH